MAHWPLVVQTAVPFGGAGQAMHMVPHEPGLVLSRHTPLQSCVPLGHVPLQEFAVGMHAPAHSFWPDGHVPPQLPIESHVGVPPSGVGHGVHALPHESTLVLSSHVAPHK
jgi:hypothetical protein